MRETHNTDIPTQIIDPKSALKDLQAAWCASVGLAPDAHLSAQSESALQNAFTGISREFDPEIHEAIVNRAQQSDRIDVLEIAAGASLPSRVANYGAPWLSRALARELGDKARITISDIDPDIRFIATGKGGILATGIINQHGEIHAATPPDASMKIAQELWGEQCRCRPVTIQELPPAIQVRAAAFAKAYPEMQTLHIAPILCQAIEERFGIAQTRAGIDALRLGEHFPEQRFDVVFSRHMYQRLKVTSLTEMAVQLGKILKPGGLGLLGFDRAGDAPCSLWAVHADGTYRLYDSRGGFSELSPPATRA